MKAFFLYCGQRKEQEQMFEDEEPKKQKPIDFDDLSIEEIEDLITNHYEEIEVLKQLLEKKKSKITLAQDFFKKS